MSEAVLTVRTDALRKHIGSRPFLALPQEEIDRLHASIEVFTADHALAEADPSVTQLVALTAIHFNYSWLAGCCHGLNDTAKLANTRSLGFSGHMLPDGHNGLFLDESMKVAASRIVDDNVGISAGYDVRLAGLLQDDSTSFGRMHLVFVYVVKLRQPGIHDQRNRETDIRFYGIGELQQNRDQFDSRSTMLIDHLVAL